MSNCGKHVIWIKDHIQPFELDYDSCPYCGIEELKEELAIMHHSASENHKLIERLEAENTELTQYKCDLSTELAVYMVSCENLKEACNACHDGWVPHNKVKDLEYQLSVAREALGRIANNNLGCQGGNPLLSRDSCDTMADIARQALEGMK